MRIEINVAPYVYQYIFARYGTGPYDLTDLKRNQMRLRFIDMRWQADLLPMPKRPGVSIALELGDDNQLSKAFNRNKLFLRAGMFFHAEFMNHLRQYVAAQESLAKKWHAKPSQWNKKQAIEDFLSEHGIDPDAYDFFSVYRQLNRLEQADDAALEQKLRKKFGFSVSENQHVKLCRIWHDRQDIIIGFQCYSRSKMDIVTKRHQIPRKLVRAGDWMSYAHKAIGIINHKLLGGYTVA